MKGARSVDALYLAGGVGVAGLAGLAASVLQVALFSPAELFPFLLMVAVAQMLYPVGAGRVDAAILSEPGGALAIAAQAGIAVAVILATILLGVGVIYDVASPVGFSVLGLALAILGHSLALLLAGYATAVTRFGVNGLARCVGPALFALLIAVLGRRVELDQALGASAIVSSVLLWVVGARPVMRSWLGFRAIASYLVSRARRLGALSIGALADAIVLTLPFIAVVRIVGEELGAGFYSMQRVLGGVMIVVSYAAGQLFASRLRSITDGASVFADALRLIGVLSLVSFAVGLGAALLGPELLFLIGGAEWSLPRGLVLGAAALILVRMVVGPLSVLLLFVRNDYALCVYQVLRFLCCAFALELVVRLADPSLGFLMVVWVGIAVEVVSLVWLLWAARVHGSRLN